MEHVRKLSVDNSQAFAALDDRCDTLEQEVIRLTAEVKTYQFLITRILVDQRRLNDRLDDLDGGSDDSKTS